MEANYQISKKEFDRIVELNSKPKKSIIVMVLVLLSLFSFIILTSQKDAYATRGYAFLGIALLNVLFLGLIQVPLFFQKRTYKTYKLIQSDITLTFTENGLRFVTPSSTMDIKWEQILQWKKDKQFILIYIAKNVYTPIAKKIAQEGFPIEELEKTLLEKVGKPVR